MSQSSNHRWKTDIPLFDLCFKSNGGSSKCQYKVTQACQPLQISMCVGSNCCLFSLVFACHTGIEFNVNSLLLGCLNGGGQIKHQGDKTAKELRMKAERLYSSIR